jgi:hypothetical protein
MPDGALTAVYEVRGDPAGEVCDMALPSGVTPEVCIRQIKQTIERKHSGTARTRRLRPVSVKETVRTRRSAMSWPSRTSIGLAPGAFWVPPSISPS